MQVIFFMEILNSVFGSDRADIGDCRLRGFLHNIAELSGEANPAFARYQRSLDEQRIAANLCPCHSGCYADLALAFNYIVAIAFFPQIFFQTCRRDFKGSSLLTHDFASNLSAKAADFSLKISHAGFSGIVTD